MANTILVVAEEEIDYDYEETPVLDDVKLLKAFNTLKGANEFIQSLPAYRHKYIQIREVELSDRS